MPAEGKSVDEQVHVELTEEAVRPDGPPASRPRARGHRAALRPERGQAVAATMRKSLAAIERPQRAHRRVRLLEPVLAVDVGRAASIAIDRTINTRYAVGVSPIREALERFRQRAIDRLRGDPNIERMVAQGLQLGEGTHIAHNVYFDGLHPWLITIGDYATLGPYVAVITHDASLAQHTGQTRIAQVVVGRRVYVGVGAILLPGTKIGEDSVVGAGAVVRDEIPPGSLVVGNPSKVSPIKAAVGWQRASAKRAPSWPQEGWTMSSGIPEERKRAQREALADGASGYVPAEGAPGSPYALRNQRP